MGEAEGWQIGALGGCPWHSERIDQRRRAITSKLDRGYEDLLDGRISDDFRARKSKAWEEEFGMEWPTFAATQLRWASFATSMKLAWPAIRSSPEGRAKDGGVDGPRTRGLCRDRAAF